MWKNMLCIKFMFDLSILTFYPCFQVQVCKLPCCTVNDCKWSILFSFFFLFLFLFLWCCLLLSVFFVCLSLPPPTVLCLHQCSETEKAVAIKIFFVTLKAYLAFWIKYLFYFFYFCLRFRYCIIAVSDICSTLTIFYTSSEINVVA